jgi:predicted NBD/HSP70 family sugar kinase
VPFVHRAGKMVTGVKKLAADWKYEVVSIGYPGPVLRNRPIADPHNMAPGWLGFNFEKAFGCPVKVTNDAAMQALGSYKRGKMLFLGLGTGLGSAIRGPRCFWLYRRRRGRRAKRSGMYLSRTTAKPRSR